MLRPLLFSILLCIICLTACKQQDTQKVPLSTKQQFERYLDVGDSIYATKSDYGSFERSMVYFDSATLLAQQIGDTVMLAEGIFAKGRVYDAWNRNQPKTVALFTEAADLYKTQDNVVREYYIRHLIAHTYEKMNDSARCVQTLLKLFNEIQQFSPEIRQKMEYIPQMARISTVVKNYDLAEKILSQLFQREWIKNNPETYNFEDHYFMTRSVIDIYKYRKFNTPYLDSFNMSLKNIHNPMDTLWYLGDLGDLYVYTDNFSKAYSILKMHQDVNQRVMQIKGVESMQNRLLQLDLNAETRKVEIEREAKRSRNIILFILLAATAVISFLLWRVRREYLKSKEASIKLAEVNEALEQKVQEVQLVNKEVQHRIKNNLHLIFSLINMQERNSENPETIESLQKAKLRVESIAGLHDQLNRSDNKDIDFHAYINKLVETVIDCMETEKKVITNLSIEHIDVPNNYFFSIGLILNEWITNSVKYAKTPSPLVLSVKMQQQGENITIEYYDNGQVQENKKLKPNLGSEIITLLTRQMRGKMIRDNDNQFHYHLTIKNG